MKHHPTQTIIIAFFVVTLGSMVMMWGIMNALKYHQIKNAYLVEKAKAEAAEKVIQIAESDCTDFDFEVSNSEAYWRYAQIRDLEY